MHHFFLLFSLFVMAFTGSIRQPAASIETTPQSPDLVFGILADVQYYEGPPRGSRYYANSPVKLAEAVEVLRQAHPDFVIQLGDLIEQDFDSYTPLLKLLEGLDQPVYHVLGNHDLSVRNNKKRKVPRLLGLEHTYYSFVYKEWRFIVLDGTEISPYAAGWWNRRKGTKRLKALKSEEAVNAVFWNGMPSGRQMEWFASELEASASRGERVIVFCHFPVYPQNAHNLWNDKDIRELMSRYDHVSAWFSGHNHAGNYGNFNHIHCVGLKGMVETENTNSFALVEIYHNKLWIKGFGREKSMILAH